MKDTSEIELNDDLFIAAGIYCKCYQHPSNKLQCIKIPIEGKKAEGVGYIYECIRDTDQSVSKRLQHYLDSDEIDHDLLCSKMLELGRYLLENQILISDLHARNVLIQLSASGEIKPVIVDGIGDRVAIEVLNLLPGFIEAKITRRWNRFVNHALNGNALLPEN